MKVAFLTNILTPYRVYFFDLLYEILKAENGDIRVFVMTKSLPLRPWNYDKLKREYTVLLKGIKFTVGSHQFMSNWMIRRAIVSFAPDALVVAGSWTYPTTWEVMLSKKITDNTETFFWTESHNHTGIPNSSKTKPMVRKIKKHIMNRFDGFCLPGKFAQETISEFVDISRKIVIPLPNLVDNNYYDVANNMREKKRELREERNISTDRFVFFTPARMRDIKGQLSFFTNVVDAVKNKHITFVLAGEGPDKEAIVKFGKENHIDIRVYNYQNQDQIREWFALSDAFLLPSLSDPNPLSNIEAAWAGLPLCISCYVGNGPELVEDGVNGVIFDTLNKDSVCTKIGFIISQDKEWLKRAGQSARQKAEEGFDSFNETNKFLTSLKEMIGHDHQLKK